MSKIFNFRKNFIFLSLFIIIALFGFYGVSNVYAQLTTTPSLPIINSGRPYTVNVSVDGQKVSDIANSPASNQDINIQANCHASSQAAQQNCGTGVGTTSNGLTPLPTGSTLGTGTLGLNTSYVISVPGSSNPEYIPSSVTVTCGSRSSSFPLNANGQADLGSISSSQTSRCNVTVNYIKDKSNPLQGQAPSCPGYTVATCSMGACVERDSSDNCEAVSSCSQQYGCDTTIGITVTPTSKTVAPGDTASYDVELTQNFMTSAPIYDLHVFTSMQATGTSVSWEIPSDQTNNLGFTNSGNTGNNVTIQMKAPKGTVRMNVKTDSSISLGSKTFYVTADTGSGPCYGKCTDTKSGLTMVVAPTMTGTLTPRTPGCEIARHASTCDVHFDWHVINPVVVGGSAVTKHPNVIVGTGDNRTNVPLAVGIAGETFYLYNNAVKLAESTVIATDIRCVSGTTWDVNKGSCETPGPNTCQNGATNFPTCTTCPSGFTMTNGACSPVVPPCGNGATNYPTCDNNTPVPTTNMSGTLTAPTQCVIGLDQSDCNATLSWTTTNPEATSAVTSQYPTSNTTVATGNDGTKTLAITHFASPQSFYLYNNGKLLDQATVLADCIAGTEWDISTQKCVSNGLHNMTGVLTPESDHCYIPLGGDSCSINFSWMTIYPEATSSVTSNVTDRGNPDPNRVLATGNNGGPKAFVIPYPSRDFYLYNNSKLLDQTITGTITAVCAPGTAWSPVNNKCESTTPTPITPSNPGNGGNNPAANTSIGASPTTIYLSESTTLTWNSGAASCTGTNFSTGGAKSGSITLSPQSTTTYTITCGGVSRSVTVVVKKKPGYIEQ